MVTGMKRRGVPEDGYGDRLETVGSAEMDMVDMVTGTKRRENASFRRG